MLDSLLRWFAPLTPTHSAKPRPKAKLELCQLEGRLVPTVSGIVNRPPVFAPPANQQQPALVDLTELRRSSIIARITGDTVRQSREITLANSSARLRQ